MHLILQISFGDRVGKGLKVRQIAYATLTYGKIGRTVDGLTASVALHSAPIDKIL